MKRLIWLLTPVLIALLAAPVATANKPPRHPKPTPPPPPAQVQPPAPPVLCPDGLPPTQGESAYDPNDDCKRPPKTAPPIVSQVTPPPPAAEAVCPGKTKPAGKAENGVLICIKTVIEVKTKVFDRIKVKIKRIFITKWKTRTVYVNCPVQGSG